MSLPAMVYYCTACNFEQGAAINWGTREYVLESGVRISVRRHLGWCEPCQGLSPIEDLSSETRIQEYRKAQRALSRLEQPGRLRMLSGLTKDYTARERFYQDQMEDAFDALEMLVTRKSPPRCLLCLSTQVHVPEQPAPNCIDQPEKVIGGHPGCGGNILTKEHPEGLRLALRPSIHRYTPDGLFIEQVFVGGYSVPESEYWDALSESNRNLRALRMEQLKDDDNLIF